MSLLTALAAAGIGFGSPLANLLVGIVVLLVLVLVGRFVLSMAWKLLLVAGLVVGALYALSILGL